MAIMGEMMEAAKDSSLIGQTGAFLWISGITWTILTLIGQWKP
jgi:hypothetical protein